MTKIDIVKAFARTEISELGESRDIFNRIIENAFDKAKNEDEEKVIGAIALKYDLPCLGYILDMVEDNGFRLPHENKQI